MHSPGSVSNVVCGFDCLGFALSEPYDEMTVRGSSEPGVRIVHHDNFGLPTEAAKNVAGVAIQALIDAAGIDHGFEIEITKHIKPGSGIGSSTASACGAVVAANRLIGDRFSKAELVELAMAGEMLASGSRHADNLAPCIYGGFTLVRSTEPLDIVDRLFRAFRCSYSSANRDQDQRGTGDPAEKRTVDRRDPYLEQPRLARRCTGKGRSRAHFAIDGRHDRRACS